MTGSSAPSAADRAVKRARLLAILEERDAESLVLSSHGALAWYLDGARTHTSLMGDPVLQVRVDRDGDRVSAFSNEAARLLAEELPSGIEVSTVPWFGALGDGFADSAGAGEAGSGVAGPRSLVESDIAAELRAARASLLPAELARYRALCSDAAEVMTDALAAASPVQPERALAASVGAGLLERGADPLVLMVSGSARAGYRHPLPRDEPVGSRAMVVACARRHGMIANITRWVSFGAPAADAFADAGARILEVEAAYFDATTAGATLRSAFEAGCAAYGEAGFAADEWRNHHQGGAAGYNGRDPRATSRVPDLVQLNQAFAWNPSAPGVKIEDTVLLGSSGIESLTVDPRWPTVQHAGRARPAELRL
ncbi:peptidase M24 [Agreia sp. PsM10]|uniref:M24 family metallopeptidase n=1 Tax=Agreia sp. PsM10 TaxID=3030533 RepID=UPI00263B7697|nr:M24 family metallopeptidase [Agreia sp. PsM10]MDN4640084.1 peptidase M24 [Agreia sp. PsM10]